jgi:hypothetical protein
MQITGIDRDRVRIDRQTWLRFLRMIKNLIVSLNCRDDSD